MKRLFSILLAAFLTLSLSAQKEEVISNAGNYSKKGGLSVSWTLGETIVPYGVSEDETMMLTPSLQPTLFVTAVEEAITTFVDVTVYPNPASEMVRVVFSEPVEKEIELFLFDAQGKLILRDVIETGILEKVIDLQSYSSGLYLMRLVQDKLVNAYRIVKQ